MADKLLTSFEQHPDRNAAYDEVHARPFPAVSTPLAVSFLGLLTDPGQVDRQRHALQKIAQQLGQSGPDDLANNYYHSFPEFDLRWERHQEFCAVAILKRAGNGADLHEPAIKAVPENLLTALGGTLVVAFHGLVLGDKTDTPDGPDPARFFAGHTLFGSRIVDDKAAVWSSFRLHDDGFSRFVIYDKSLSAFQAGRTLQRVMEVETYRVMALLGLPLARRIAPDVARMDIELAAIIDRIADVDDFKNEQQLLSELSDVAAVVEQLMASCKYRFSATRAYHELVRKRLADLREVRFSGVSTLGKFLERRLDPAVRTCIAVEEQLRDLSKRVSRASDFLSTRVNLTIEGQNQQLLQSMNRRSALQLRLQQTVEGLSVVVISYYSVGLIKTLLTAAAATGLNINIDLISGIVVIPVVTAVWLLVRRVRNIIDD